MEVNDNDLVEQWMRISREMGYIIADEIPPQAIPYNASIPTTTESESMSLLDHIRPYQIMYNVATQQLGELLQRESEATAQRTAEDIQQSVNQMHLQMSRESEQRLQEQYYSERIAELYTQTQLTSSPMLNMDSVTPITIDNTEEGRWRYNLPMPSTYVAGVDPYRADNPGIDGSTFTINLGAAQLGQPGLYQQLRGNGNVVPYNSDLTVDSIRQTLGDLLREDPSRNITIHTGIGGWEAFNDVMQRQTFLDQQEAAMMWGRPRRVGAMAPLVDGDVEFIEGETDRMGQFHPSTPSRQPRAEKIPEWYDFV